MQLNRNFSIESVRDYINNSSQESTIFIGCDSERFIKKEKEKAVWWSAYSTVIVIHIDGNKGCKIFGNVDYEKDFDQKFDRPIMRMMNEVYRVSEMYLLLKDVLEDRKVQIHIDVNPDEKHGSNCAYTQAIGYVKGMCGITPLVKPTAFAASTAADRYRSIMKN